jgi:hypothetical protein
MRTRILALAIGLAVTLAKAEAPRRPRGIYANVNISDKINQQTKANPSITESGLQTYFDGLYQSLLANPAVSGLSIQVHWDTLNPRDFTDPKPYDWTYLDPAFNDVAAWNVANPTATKTIQLIVTPGFQTPPWVLAKLNSCDGLFQTPPVTLSSCGKATFTGFKENADGTELPMPWNSTYKSNWKTFLTALATQYGSNSALASIAVAGPTAASAEMILPNNGNTPAQSGIQPDDMWVKLLTFHYPGKPAYQNTDQAFIDEWNAAIDMYSGIFSGITLVATTGNGLPTLSGTFTVPKDFTAYCKVPADMDCAAETTILSHFADATVGGANAKAVQTSGMEASRGSCFINS